MMVYTTEAGRSKAHVIPLHHIMRNMREKDHMPYANNEGSVFALSGSSLVDLQSNLNSSDTDGSFTMAYSNSFLSPYEILPLAQENKYLGKFSYFIMKLYVVCTH